MVKRNCENQSKKINAIKKLRGKESMQTQQNPKLALFIVFYKKDTDNVNISVENFLYCILNSQENYKTKQL